MNDFNPSRYISENLPDFDPTGEHKKLLGGNLNHVWRVYGRNRSVILKFAPPHIATAPDIPIDPGRILIEATALSLFEKTPFEEITGDEIRPPKLLFSDPDKHIVILEDVGPLPTLDQINTLEPELGSVLGKFIAQLHLRSFEKQEIRKKAENLSIQKTRLEVQYSQIPAILTSNNISDATELGEKAIELGNKFVTAGRCFIMGDLWPKSILIDQQNSAKIRLIDWEFAHFGYPAQDIAHLLAHLWMLEHRATSEKAESLIRDFSQKFCSSYFELINSRNPLLWQEQETYNSGIHYGCEILMRCAGTFKSGYVYEDLSSQDEVLQEALSKAVVFLRKPMNFNTYLTSHE